MTSQTSELVERLRLFAQYTENLFMADEHGGPEAAATTMIEAADLIEALSASTQVDAMREALEEARPYVEGYAQLKAGTGTHLQAVLVARIAKIDAALTSS